MAYAKAVSKYMRVPPRKARLAANLIRGLEVRQALAQLSVSQLKAGRLLKKTVESAVANGELQHDLRRDTMRVLEVRVDCGPILKRSKPRSRGSQMPVMKRLSHFTVVVGE